MLCWDGNSTLEINVFDEDMIGKDDFLGVGTFE
jgi:hypothetical protein